MQSIERKLKAISILSLIYGSFAIILGVNSSIGFLFFFFTSGFTDAYTALEMTGTLFFPLAFITGILFIRVSKKIDNRKNGWKSNILIGTVLIVTITIVNFVLKENNDHFNSIMIVDIIVNFLAFSFICAVPIATIIISTRIKPDIFNTIDIKDQILPGKKKWFKRNKYWFIPIISNAPLLFCGGLLIPFFYMISSKMNDSEATKLAKETISNNEKCIELLGENIEFGMPSGSLTENNYADMYIPVNGEKRKAYAYFHCSYENNKWEIDELSLKVDSITISIVEEQSSQ